MAGARGRRNMVASLLLTSLVDAFSILVIFLIMSHSSSQDVVNTGQIVLPQADESQFIQQGIVVRIEDGGAKVFIEEQLVPQSELITRLKSLNESADVARKDGLVIVADRQMDYEGMSPIILAGSQAGFTKFKFAVLRK